MEGTKPDPIVDELVELIEESVGFIDGRMIEYLRRTNPDAPILAMPPGQQRAWGTASLDVFVRALKSDDLNIERPARRTTTIATILGPEFMAPAKSIAGILAIARFMQPLIAERFADDPARLDAAQERFLAVVEWLAGSNLKEFERRMAREIESLPEGGAADVDALVAKQGSGRVAANPWDAGPDGPRLPELDRLSDREREVLRLLGMGHSVGEIAGVLGIAQNTVRNHVRSLREKTGLHDQAQLAVYALCSGACTPQDAREGLARKAGEALV